MAVRPRTIVLGALALGAGVLLFATPASAKERSDKEIAKAVQELLSSSGFNAVPANPELPNLLAVSLTDLASGAPSAASWANDRIVEGKAVLVPRWMVDGKSYKFGGSGLPRLVIALPPAEASFAMLSGAYVKVQP